MVIFVMSLAVFVETLNIVILVVLDFLKTPHTRLISKNLFFIDLINGIDHKPLSLAHGSDSSIQ